MRSPASACPVQGETDIEDADLPREAAGEGRARRWTRSSMLAGHGAVLVAFGCIPEQLTNVPLGHGAEADANRVISSHLCIG